MCTKSATILYIHRRHYKECKEKCKNLTVGKFKMKNVTLQELLFEDSMMLVAENEEKLQ
jgi:hypothetical protein